MTARLVLAVFMLLAVMTGVAAASSVLDAAGEAGSWGEASFSVLKAVIATAFVVLVAIRPAPRRRSRDPVAFAACLMAIAPGIALQPPPSGGLTPNLAGGEAVTLLGGAWMLVSVLYLGRCFGVLPEARGLVTRGPYRIVRHPLYLGELTAFAGLVLASPTTVNLALAGVFFCGQAIRMRLEEAALRAEFPRYAEYAAATPRLLPGVGPRDRSLSSTA
jgi:protein-S-isoprenylcysteine O-methyltransferase Ste14